MVTVEVHGSGPTVACLWAPASRSTVPPEATARRASATDAPGFTSTTVGLDAALAWDDSAPPPMRARAAVAATSRREAGGNLMHQSSQFARACGNGAKAPFHRWPVNVDRLTQDDLALRGIDGDGVTVAVPAFQQRG